MAGRFILGNGTGRVVGGVEVVENEKQSTDVFSTEDGSVYNRNLGPVIYYCNSFFFLRFCHAVVQSDPRSIRLDTPFCCP